MPKTKKVQTKAPENGGRRYDKGEFYAYDSVYEEKKNKSFILNPKVRQRNTATAFKLIGLAECQSTLKTLIGNPEKDGRYYDQQKKWQMAAIPIAKNRLGRIYRKYKLWQKRQIQTGETLVKPDWWPDDLRKECLKAQALFDLRRKEKAFVENRIEKLKNKKEPESESKPILPNGPVGNFWEKEWEQKTVKHRSGKDATRNVRVDKLFSVDGQSISYSPSGIPYINEDDSPYHLMPVATYKKMSKAWMKKHRIQRMDLHERKNEFRAKCEEKGIELPANFTRRKFEGMVKGETKFKGQDNWPDFEPWPENPSWPNDAKKITKIEKE